LEVDLALDALIPDLRAQDVGRQTLIKDLALKEEDLHVLGVGDIDGALGGRLLGCRDWTNKGK
jgi:hypothetical protein